MEKEKNIYDLSNEQVWAGSIIGGFVLSGIMTIGIVILLSLITMSVALNGWFTTTTFCLLWFFTSRAFRITYIDQRELYFYERDRKG